jgi:predicted lactoylglutathione lyase
VDQRVSVITLGVADVRRARGFYEALGWHQDGSADDEGGQIAFFRAGGLIVSLRDRARLAVDSGVLDRGCWAGVTLGYAVDSPIDVDMVLAEARGAGATITQPGSRTRWGGYSGVFVDPDGQAWEVLHDPAWTLRDDGPVSD